MTPVVVDASVALKLIIDEPGRDAIRRHLHAAIQAGAPLLVPALFWLEVINVLAFRYRLPPSAIVEAVYELERLSLATTEIGRPGTLAVIDAVGRSGLTAYDAAYLVLAESSGASILTADAALAAASGDRATLIAETDGIAEGPAPYAADRSWARWPGAAAYLAELRRAV